MTKCVHDRPLVLYVSAGVRQIWVSLTEAQPHRVTSDEKRQWLAEPILNGYRDLVRSSGLVKSFDAVVDGECPQKVKWT